MEITNNIINDEIKPEKVYTETQKRALKAYHERHQDSEKKKVKKQKRAYEKKKYYSKSKSKPKTPSRARTIRAFTRIKRTRFNNLWKNDIKR
jgi:hypothetical protein